MKTNLAGIVLEEEEDEQEEEKQETPKNSHESAWTEVDPEWRPNWLPEYNGGIGGASSSVPENTTEALEYFELYFDAEIIDLIVVETNRYAENFFTSKPEKRQQEFYKYWKDCSALQIKAYLGILIHMGIQKLPRLAYHRKTQGIHTCSFCPNIMSKAEFNRIHTFLHLVDNDSANKADKLYKVRPLLHLLIRRYQRFYKLNREITIDEKMIKYTGRVSILQYMHNKPTRFGFKVFLLCDAHNGYIYNWRFYTGKQNEQTHANLAPNIVLELLRCIEDEGHHVYADSFFTYLPLITQLAEKGFATVGTLNKRRRLIPDVIKNPPKNQKKGETIFRRQGKYLAFGSQGEKNCKNDE